MAHCSHKSLSATMLFLTILLLVARTLAAPPQLNRLLANPAPPFNAPPKVDTIELEEGTAVKL
ncbi:hypothetical protein PtrV1_06054 [Pyrenophora tritici-repentis]|uniref:Uncharacterized protein n=1 Tax=Pyrenophora tritici-repentis TaxID=45151 RepID=A0A5M9LE64_9PLEO|nr:hypothetical protein PtrV1_06054 [Pyrenophora tritici-repentis]KAF7450794.1 hypothetical protein A1F99_054100 [Pyrenophora tritici-repentis]KAF7573444.1 hypothetical protein PtrM4_083490 [Pyrenophora tritici-repentis]KAI1516250.1 hypothetical protein Ptr86124_004787 [Pyrenophora tritici-repentis]KAI1685342.1 hypothetical protein KJE20_05626 [Pyrenophora tritici-repentis]